MPNTTAATTTAPQKDTRRSLEHALTLIDFPMNTNSPTYRFAVGGTKKL